MKSKPVKQTKQESGPINQHKRMAMGLPIPNGSVGTGKKKK